MAWAELGNKRNKRKKEKKEKKKRKREIKEITSWGLVGPSSAFVGAVHGGLGMLIRFKLAMLSYRCFDLFNKLICN